MKCKIPGMLVATLAVLMGSGCATQPVSPVTGGARADRPVLSTDELPEHTAVTDGEEPLHLSISPPPSISITGVTAAADADLTVTFVERSKERTMVTLKKSDRLPTLKVDLYISPDGEIWHYTSSCPINVSVYEMWPHLVPFLAVANVRQAVASEEGLCN